MKCPGFTADASLGPTLGIYRSEAVFGGSAASAGHYLFAAEAFGGSTAIQNRGAADALRSIGRAGGASNFVCSRTFCTCRGTDDCVDLWVNTDLCGPDNINCSPDLSYCTCRRKGA
jgi:hypothetical protein